MYKAFKILFTRFLKPGGHFIMEDTHDFFRSHDLKHSIKHFIMEVLLANDGEMDYLGRQRHVNFPAREIQLEKSLDVFGQWVDEVRLHGKYYFVVTKRQAVRAAPKRYGG